MTDDTQKHFRNQEDAADGLADAPTDAADLGADADRGHTATKAVGQSGKFDLDQLRASSTIIEKAGIERPLLTVPVRKPTKQMFFRTHPNPDFLPPMWIIEEEETAEAYLLADSIAQQLLGECKLVQLTPYITRQGVLMLWPLRMPEPDGRTHAAHTSSRQVAELARKKWARMVWNRQLGAYDMVLVSTYGEPEWPQLERSKLLELAFGDERLVENAEHPLIRKLMGR